MPKRSDLSSILILGAGPVVIGQACEFDYSGTQACKSLREEGYRVVLVNSNPATIMTDPDSADASYIEAIHWRDVSKIIEVERPDAILPTMGGQMALNCALDLQKNGILQKFDVQMIGASYQAIQKAEDRSLFKKAMDKIGLRSAHSFLVSSTQEALDNHAEIGFPIVVRPSCTLGGSGGGIAYDVEDLSAIVEAGIAISPLGTVLLEESLLGWKEFEMEVVRDHKDNCIVVCCIENIDPMGVHTGDSITVAPCQTLTDKEYQRMRHASFKVLREIGVDTGGSNVQFAVHPDDGSMVVVEMNPRVSRSSALASKATGFPIAKIAAKLAVGCTLDELGNEITGDAIPASFEPAIDYVVTKIPRFSFDKFKLAKDALGTQMKSVGECMAIGRNFQESLQKAILSLENNFAGLDADFTQNQDEEELIEDLGEKIDSLRLWRVAEALKRNISIKTIYQKTRIDPWFLHQIGEIVDSEAYLTDCPLEALDAGQIRSLKQQGFSDSRLAALMHVSPDVVRAKRLSLGVAPTFKCIDTCAAEFASTSDYLYSSYDQECEVIRNNHRKIMILGGGPNRIGQGIEFDYCCVHAALVLKEAGVFTIMVNCNPETVSTDYDTADRLYFEPLSAEHVLNIVDLEKPDGVIVQYGGQTPLNLVDTLEKYGVPIIGTQPQSIRLCEDREHFEEFLSKLNLKRPPNLSVSTLQQAMDISHSIDFPVIVRPSYVLGGQAMQIIYDRQGLEDYMRNAETWSQRLPILIDVFLQRAIEVDVDAVSDGKRVVVSAIMEHIEEAGIHSGDSACCIPCRILSLSVQKEIIAQVEKLTMALQIVGLINIQFAIKNQDIFVLEVNPRASRTIPFVSKVTGIPFAKAGALCMSGISLDDQGLLKPTTHTPLFAVKEAVFPFNKFSGSDPILGPEMHSTGEVMGMAKTFGRAFKKAQNAAGIELPLEGCVLLSIKDSDKDRLVELAKKLLNHGFQLEATKGSADCIRAAGIPCRQVNKLQEGSPNVVERIKAGRYRCIINTTEGKKSIADSFEIRNQAMLHKFCYTTTINGAFALMESIQQEDSNDVYCLQKIPQALLRSSHHTGVGSPKKYHKKTGI